MEIFAPLFSPEALISLITLIFLEIILGVDNIVFISITSEKLPVHQKRLGRKLGLAGAMCMRILFLCFASFLIHMVTPLFTISLSFYQHGFSIRDLVMGLGGIYLIYKGIIEIKEVMSLRELKENYALSESQNKGEEADTFEKKSSHKIGLVQAVGTIMVMDIVFSIDSVITAVGLANQLIIMILAVMIAVFFMMAFIDVVSEFINTHVEMKFLALFFISVIGILLLFDGLGINSGIEVLDMHMEKVMVYFGMLFSFTIQIILIIYNDKVKKWKATLS